MARRKPKPVEAGTIICRNDHGEDKKQIRVLVKFSIVMQKLYIDCPECGKIMPTLPNMQKHIKNNADFDPVFLAEYGPNIGLGEKTKKPEPEKVPESISEPEPEPEPEKVQESISEPEPEKKKPEKSDYEQEMGF